MRAPVAVAISRWKMSERAATGEALIGPNAVLQLLPQIEKICGASRLSHMLAEAGLPRTPDGRDMIPEIHAVRLHQMLRREEPERSGAMAAAAGKGTARYILQHRIPKPIQRILKALPAFMSARLLSKAIAHHAWTFAGSGKFQLQGSWTFKITDNPIVRGETSQTPLCLWHAAVFEYLYRELVHPDVNCVETSCCAQGSVNACIFELTVTMGRG